MILVINFILLKSTIKLHHKSFTIFIHSLYIISFLIYIYF